MISLIITLVVYSVLILVFVPLDKIAKAQTWVKNKIKDLKNKIDN